MSIPSPFALDLGTVVFDLSYQDVYLGSGSGPNTHLVFFIPLAQNGCLHLSLVAGQ